MKEAGRDCVRKTNLGSIRNEGAPELSHGGLCIRTRCSMGFAHHGNPKRAQSGGGGSR